MAKRLSAGAARDTRPSARLAASSAVSTGSDTCAAPVKMIAEKRSQVSICSGPGSAPPTGNRVKLATSASISLRCPSMARKMSIAITVMKAASTPELVPRSGSVSCAKDRPAAAEMASAPSATASKANRKMKPMARPTTTCWTTASHQSAPNRGISGGAGSTIASSSARASAIVSRARGVTLRAPSTGAMATKLLVRRSGQSSAW